jgi:hypothetical protein
MYLIPISALVDNCPWFRFDIKPSRSATLKGARPLVTSRNQLWLEPESILVRQAPTDRVLTFSRYESAGSVNRAGETLGASARGAMSNRLTAGTPPGPIIAACQPIAASIQQILPDRVTTRAVIAAFEQ